MLSPPELGKAETISAIDSATNMVMNTTATQPQTTLTGPAKECHGLFSIFWLILLIQQTARPSVCVKFSSVS